MSLVWRDHERGAWRGLVSTPRRFDLIDQSKPWSGIGECFWNGKAWYCLQYGFRRGYTWGCYLEAPKLHCVSAKLKLFSIEYDPVFCAMEEEIEGSFDIGVIELGVIYYFYFAGDVFYYFIISSGVSIARCKVALWHPQVHESSPFCDEGCWDSLFRRTEWYPSTASNTVFFSTYCYCTKRGRAMTWCLWQ